MSRPFNPESTDWRAAKELMHEKIRGLQDELENEDTQHERTQFLRGRIFQMRELIDLKETK